MVAGVDRMVCNGLAANMLADKMFEMSMSTVYEVADVLVAVVDFDFEVAFVSASSVPQKYLVSGRVVLDKPHESAQSGTVLDYLWEQKNRLNRVH
eukprot:10149366-Ditylum_brightwellii.AAC.1